jgi:hypothetical protein
MKLLSSSMWRALRFEQGAPYWSDEAGVKTGDAVNEDGVDTRPVVEDTGGTSVCEGEFVADVIPKSVAEG